MKFRLLPPAAGELRLAARYYEQQFPDSVMTFFKKCAPPFSASFNGRKPGSRLMKKSAAAARIVFLMALFTWWKMARCWLFP
jgi:hypothetical protein